MRALTAALFLVPVLAAVSPAYAHSPIGKTRPAPTPNAPRAAEIRDGNEIVIHEADGTALVSYTAHDHEGLAELVLSPDHRWATALVTNPVDGPGANNPQKYRMVVHLRSGLRLDLDDFPKHFEIDCTPKDIFWKRGLPSTISAKCTGDTENLIEMPPAGVPPIRTNQ